VQKMNCITYRYLFSSLFKAGLLYVLVFTYGCSNPTSIEEDGITFKNSTPRSLVLSVYEQQSLSLISLHFEESRVVDIDSLNILEPGQDTTVSQQDVYTLDRFRPAKDIGVFISEVKNDSIFYKGRYNFTEDQLEKYKHQLIIKEGTNDSLVVGE